MLQIAGQTPFEFGIGYAQPNRAPKPDGRGCRIIRAEQNRWDVQVPMVGKIKWCG